MLARHPFLIHTGLIPVIEALARQSQQMASVLGDLLDVARITEGKIERKRRILDLRELVQPAVESVQHRFDSRGQSLQGTLADEPGLVYGDPVRRQQVAANLLSIAKKYIPPDSIIQVQLDRRNDRAELRLVDEGEGIPPEFLPRIFEPFEQLGKKNDSAGRWTGTGFDRGQIAVPSARRNDRCPWRRRSPVSRHARNRSDLRFIRLFWGRDPFDGDDSFQVNFVW